MSTPDNNRVILRIGDAEVVITGEPWPRRLRSRSLQKGAVLTIASRDVVGEGVGFGVPIAFIGGRFVYSTHAEVEEIDGGVRKTFNMDSISTKRWGNRLFSGLPGPEAFFDGWLVGNLSPLYRSRVFAQVVANGFWRFERLTGAIEHGYSSIRTRGNVTVEYKINDECISVTVDPTELGPDCYRVSIMNELDASIFNEYDDSEGLMLHGWRIGSWSPVKAEWARFTAGDGSSSFKLRRIEDAQLFRGREIIPGHLSWAGLAYELKRPLGRFNYTIEIGRG